MCEQSASYSRIVFNMAQWAVEICLESCEEENQVSENTSCCFQILGKDLPHCFS